MSDHFVINKYVFRRINRKVSFDVSVIRLVRGFVKVLFGIITIYYLVMKVHARAYMKIQKPVLNNKFAHNFAIQEGNYQTVVCNILISNNEINNVESLCIILMSLK